MIDRSVPPAGVVVGVDGDPATLRAIGWAAHEAKRRELPLDLVQILPPSSRPEDELRAPSGRALSLMESARRLAVGAEPGVSPRLSVADGVVGPSLVAVARQARLLVLGSRGHDGALDLTIGRTLVHALGQAQCPVVVVPPRWDPAAAHTGPVVAGVDGSPESDGAVVLAAEVADRWQSRLTIAAVTRHQDPGTDGEARRLLTTARAGVSARHPDLPVEEVVGHGTPGEELLACARDGAALLVVGSRGRGALVGSLIGSTSQAVVRFAPCPVAVLPPAAAARRVSPEQARAEEGV